MCAYVNTLFIASATREKTSDGDSLALVKHGASLISRWQIPHCVVNVGQGHQDFTHDLLTVSFSDRENPLHLFQELWAPKVLHDHVVVVLKRVWQQCVRTTSY